MMVRRKRPSRGREKKHKPPACRICKCTQYRACPQGCEWVEPDLCSFCKSMIEDIASYVMGAASVSKASLLKMYDEALRSLSK